MSSSGSACHALAVGIEPWRRRLGSTASAGSGATSTARLPREEPGFEIVAVNDLASPEVLAHVLKYDSSHGVLEGQVEHGDGEISVDGKSFEVLSERDPTALPWADRGVDVVIESTGLFTDREGASQHLTAGAKKVVISAPATDPDVTLVLGVNDDKYDPAQHNLISMASCTTNSVGPMAKILMDTFGINWGS